MRRRLGIGGLAVALGLGGWIANGDDAGAATACGPSAGWTLCISVPDGSLSGEVPVTVSTTGTDVPFEVALSWGPSATSTTPLYSDFEAPFSFIWPTDRYADATQWLVARVEPANGATGAPVALRLTIDNDNDTAPQHPADYATRFTPRVRPGDPVLAAVGDGASGRTRSNQLAESIGQSNAAVLLQLGDVYERGTRTEYFNHYGIANVDDPARSTAWGRLASYTLPTGGNHELHSTSDDGTADYWHHRPLYFTEVVGGVRVISLASECGRVGGCGTTSPQYQWARQVLAANTHPCVVAMWHRPVISSVEDSTAMQPLWSLVASNGGDLVLSAHTHSMSSYRPMNAELQVGQPDSHVVQIISGAGGHNLVSAVETDPRVQWERTKLTGAAYVTAIGGADGVAGALSWRFADATGATVTSAAGVPGTGSVDCSPGGGGPSPIFTEDFGDLFDWRNVVNVSLDSTQGGTTPPSARATAVDGRAFAFHDIAPRPSVCVSARVNVLTSSTSVVLLRLRSTTGASLARLALNPQRRLVVRNDVAGTANVTTATLPAGWSRVELCATVGTPGSLQALLNGTSVATPTGNLGTAAIARIQIFDGRTGRTFDARLDDLVVDTEPG